MGQLSHDPTIRHFSHPHPLELANQQGRGHPHNPLLPQPLCSGCTLPPHGYMYACKTCNYSFTLHASCAQLPSHITHPSHPKHHLTLLHSPPYAGGSFNCDACGKRGTAFCYQCSECDFDIHTTCASKPLSVPHRLHHYHHLNLEFFPPYQPQRFSCDICGNAGSNHWLYRCASCEFDAHLDCATAAGTSGQSSLPSPQPQLRPQQQPQHLQHQLSYPGPYPPPQHHQQHQLHHQNSVPAVVMHYQSNYQNVPRPPPPVSPVYGQQPYLQPQPQQPRPPVLPVYLQQQPPPPAAPVYGQQQPQQQQQQQGIMDTMVQNFVGGAAQQAGQMAVENLMGGGGANASNANDPTATDPSSGGDGGNGDSSVIGSVFGSMFGGSVE